MERASISRRCWAGARSISSSGRPGACRAASRCRIWRRRFGPTAIIWQCSPSTSGSTIRSRTSASWSPRSSSRCRSRSIATLFCDTYIVESRPAIGAACAAHARQIEQVRRTRPELTWITVAYPVWTDGEDIRAYRQRLGVTIPIGIDRGNAWFRRFGVRNTYTTIVLDGSGAELGRVDGDGAGLAALIARAH